MANTYKRLGATTVTADTDASLFQVPADHEYIVSELTICNTGSTQRTFRIAVVDGAIGSVANEDYKFYDIPIEANAAITLKPGFAMAASESLLVRANHADVVFSASGVDIDNS